LSLISSLIYPEIQKDETLISNWKQIAIEAISSVVMNETHTHQ
jgi:hypothetical protein